MVLTTIYVTRHGFRLNWTVDPHTGTYSSIHDSPTNIPSDPPLAAHGVVQSEQLAVYLAKLSDPPIARIYSSPFYRCLQTIKPYVLSLPSDLQHVKGDNGLGEWYGHARFTHPSPASPTVLNNLFPFYDLEYKPSVVPSTQGETIEELHQRCAYALHSIIQEEDAKDKSDKEQAILICSHAAPMIAMGRALTGKLPKDLAEDDFKTYTCGVSKFVRRTVGSTTGKGTVDRRNLDTGVGAPGKQIPDVDWQDGKGIGGGWDCVVNSTCEHLEDGEERGWSFSEAETFI